MAVRPRVSGTVEPGLMLVGDPSVRPATVTIRGAAPDVAILDALRTEPIDVTGLPAGRHERRVELALPVGHLEVVDDSVVSVTFDIAPEIAERAIPRQEISVTGGTLREIRPNRVRITLRGAPAVLDALDAPSIVPYVDASALNPSSAPSRSWSACEASPKAWSCSASSRKKSSPPQPPTDRTRFRGPST